MWRGWLDELAAVLAAERGAPGARGARAEARLALFAEEPAAPGGDPFAAACLLARGGQGGEARRRFAEVAVLDPADVAARAAGEEDDGAPGELLLRAARIYEEELKDEERAIACYRGALERAPGHAGALEALGRIYESTERWGAFLETTEALIAETEDREQKGLLHFKCGSVLESKFADEEGAIRHYQAAIDSASSLPAVHGLREIYQRRRDVRGVIATLELEIEMWKRDKERAGVYARLGEVHATELGDLARALECWEKARSLDRDCALANRRLFAHYLEEGRWEEARPLADALAGGMMREGEPAERSEFFRQRARVVHRTGNPELAAESLVVSLEIDPGNVAALEQLGEMARAEPWAFDFAATYRELEKLYRRRPRDRELLVRVLVTQAIMREREGDLDGARELYESAWRLAPGDVAVLDALVHLDVGARRWERAAGAIERFLAAEPPPAPELAVRLLLRLAELRSEGELDPAAAIDALRRALAIEPEHVEALYRLAQESYLAGRFEAARAAVERAIEVAARAESRRDPERLARLHYYLGHVLDAGGDGAGAAREYGRAHELDPACAPAALALAHRLADAGEPERAEALLLAAAEAAIARGGRLAAVPLQRGLARILLAGGERGAAVEAYRGILAVEESPEDRVALAEVYAAGDLGRAIFELQRVLERDLRHAPAYRLLASYYAQSGEPERAARVVEVMELLGYAEEEDRALAAAARPRRAPLCRPLPERERELLGTPEISTPAARALPRVAAALAARMRPPRLGQSLEPLRRVGDPGWRVAIADAAQVFGVHPELWVGTRVPGGVAVVAHPRAQVALDRRLLGESEAARRFLLGWAFDQIRGGYALLLRLRPAERRELATALAESGARPRGDLDAWVEGMAANARRAGLFSSDHLPEAARMLAFLAGEELELGERVPAPVGMVVSGEDLVRFYLSDDYQAFREALGGPAVAS